MIKRAYLNAILRTAFARGCAVLDEQDNAKSIDRVTFESTAQSPMRWSSLCRPVRKARSALCGSLILLTLTCIAEARWTLRKACAFGLEGLVSKHRDRPYQAGRSKHWIKMLWGGMPLYT